MGILTVKHVSHGFGDRVIFNDVSFRLLKGEHIGLIGANGEGKSTFMSIITNKLMPDKGVIEWANHVQIGYLDQHTVLDPQKSIRETLHTAFDYLYAYEAEMIDLYNNMGDMAPEELDTAMEKAGHLQELLEQHNFYNIDVKINEFSMGIGLFDIGLDRSVDDLSGGQRTKVLLCKLLLAQPDILLLDEPTNYLDEEHIEWLKKYLLNYENAFILISHDIPFLDEVTNIIYHVENANLTRYVGNYNEFLRVYEENKKQVEAAFERQQMEIQKLETFVAKNKARAATAGMARSRQIQLDKMEIIELAKEKPKPQFNFQFARSSDKLIFETKDLVIGYDKPLSDKINLLMERGMKIAITGANGIGKTTLMRSLLGEIEPISGHIEHGGNRFVGYFKQEIKGEGDKTCIEDVWNEFPSFAQVEVRAALAKCGLTTKQLESKLKVLSGGEQAKVRLCKIMNKASNVLFLDEPTNHLDVDAKAELKRALLEYKCAILMICHDPDFYAEICSTVWDFAKMSKLI